MLITLSPRGHSTLKRNMDDQNSKCDFSALCSSIEAARKELAKLRKDVKGIKEMFVKRFNKIEAMLKCRETEKNVANSFTTQEKDTNLVTDTFSSNLGSIDSMSEPQLIKSSNAGGTVVLTNQMVNSCVIGHIRTCFKEKNGIPRQGSVCPLSKAVLCIDGVKEFTNPGHALQGLENFSHVWLLFLFHKNSNNSIKAKVRPPRLGGSKVGVFASRSPHRPSPIGLTLAHLDGIEGNKLLLSGIDILDGTPILDIKPYIPDYDSVHNTHDHDDRKTFEKCMPGHHKEHTMSTTKTKVPEDRVSTLPEDKLVVNELHSVDKQHFQAELNNDFPNAVISNWIRHPVVAPLSVSYSDKAKERLGRFYNKDNITGSEKYDDSYRLELLASAKDVQKVIKDILREDPRSNYRRNHCPDELYHFAIDKVNVSCIFKGEHVQVIDINPV